ncbi:type II toxin-antitoxin system PemK/MazF family toxin [Pseudomonas sp. TE3610]
MPLLYQPKAGTIVMCDFRGHERPEMVKTRPVVVLRRNSQNSSLVTVVPLSTTAPLRLESCHVEFDSLIPGSQIRCWAKCDMVYTVGCARLDRIKTRDRVTGRRDYVVLPLPADLFVAIQRGVKSALGL